MRIILTFMAGVTLVSTGSTGWMINATSLQDGLLILAAGSALMYFSLFLLMRS